MSTLKAGDVAYLKTTQEPVFVIEIHNAEIGIALVRRPVGGEDTGVRHELNLFFVTELETKEDLQNRQKANILQFISGNEAGGPDELESADGKMVN